MEIHFTPEQEKIINSKVSRGQYSSPEVLIDEALALLNMRDEIRAQRKAEIEAMIQAGLNAAEAGRFISADDSRIRTEAIIGKYEQ
jgi:Arc/MetJ-type ribon-helix-helix transcriptional regulator